MPEPAKREPVPTERVSLATIFARFVTIGALSFGGGIVAYLQRMLIDQTKWLTADEFLAALEISQTMPGLNAVNMSVLVGDRLRGPIGAFVAALGMVAPGAIFVFLLGLAAAEAPHQTPIANAALSGIAAGATGLLLAIALRTGHKQFMRPVRHRVHGADVRGDELPEAAPAAHHSDAGADRDLPLSSARRRRCLTSILS